MTRVANTLAGPAGALVIPTMPTAAGNAGGTIGLAPDFLPTIGATAGLTFDATHLRNGANSLHVVANAVDTQAYARWNTGATSPAGVFQTSATTVYMWCDVYFAALPAASHAVMAMLNTAGGIMATLRVLSTGFVSCRDSGGTNGSTTTNASTGKVVTGQWCRVEAKVTFSATVGQTEVRVFPTATFGTPGDTNTSAATLNTGTALYGAVVGTVNATTVANYWVANAGFSDVGYPTMYQACLAGWAGGATATGFVGSSRTIGTASVRMKVSTTSDLLTSPVYSSAATPESTSGLALMSIGGLAADTVYYYGFELDGTVDPQFVGHVRTAPTAGSQASFSFVAASCARTFSNHVVFDAMRTHTGVGGRTAAFFQHLGDRDYRDIVANTPALFQRSWDESLSCPRQQSLMSSLSTSYIWSDHDSGGGSNNDGTAVAHASAQAVYRLRVPTYSLPAADNAGTYFSYVWGRVRFICTDGRSYMSPIANTDDSSKTKLGATQKAWLKTQLSMPEPIKVWFHEDSWNNGTTYTGDDTWSAYSTERTEIASYINTNGILCVIVHGDLHCLGADDGSHSPGGIPVYICAPMDQTTYAGNGTYSSGTYPNPTDGAVYSQLFGWFDVTDNGGSIVLDYRGYDSGGTARVSQSTTFTLPTGGQPKAWNGTAWVHVPAKAFNGTSWAEVPVKTWNGTSWVAVS
jgi:alkaline phosphatase D